MFFKPLKKILALAIYLSILIIAPSVSQSQEIKRNKILEFGWDNPGPEFVRDNIKEMETRPFDGLIFRTTEYNNAFDTTRWSKKKFKPEMDVLAAIKWERFTDNFLILYSANSKKMDWFNDAQWDTITVNMRLFSKALKAGKCVGVCFDNEPYGEDPWVYTGKYPGKSYEEVSTVVRKRGRQFMKALGSSMPEIKILNFFQFSYYGDTSEETHNYRKEARWDLLNEPDKEIRTQKLSERWLALLYPFLIGMLEEAGPGVTFIDGNEFAYYYDSPDDFYRHYYIMKHDALSIIPENLRKKYAAQTQAGMAVYYDILAGDNWGYSFQKFVPSNFMTPVEKLQYLEQNVYYSLSSTDEYVWFYSERMNWWKDLAGKSKPVDEAPGIPSGIEEAIISAKDKHKNGKPLGYDISGTIARCWEKVNSAYNAQEKK